MVEVIQAETCARRTPIRGYGRPMEQILPAFQTPWVQVLKPVRTPVTILGSLGVCIYVPASRHWLISYSPIHLT